MNFTSFKIFTAVLFSFFILTACNQAKDNSKKDEESDLRKKELELKEKELEIREKELEKQDEEKTEQKTDHLKANDNNEAFYIVNVAATTSASEARTMSEKLKDEGYNSGFLWIPDYASLSGAQYYTVYIGPFSTQKECEIATEDYKRVDSKAYGLKVSQEKKRVQINGIGKVTVTNINK